MRKGTKKEMKGMRDRESGVRGVEATETDMKKR